MSPECLEVDRGRTSVEEFYANPGRAGEGVGGGGGGNCRK